MPAEKVRELDRLLDQASMLTTDQRAIIRFAEKATRSPAELSVQDVATFYEASGGEGCFIEAVNVIAEFNFITRIADALGVDLEIPPRLQRIGFVRTVAINLMGRMLGSAFDLTSRQLDASATVSILSRLDQTFVKKLALEHRPAFFERLVARPYILESLAHVSETFLTGGELPAEAVIMIGALVFRLTGNKEDFETYRRLLERRGLDSTAVDRVAQGQSAGLEAATEKMLRFAREMTLHAYKITDEQVQELRTSGIGDEKILDLAVVAANFNAISRISMIFALVPAKERVEPIVEQMAN
jgi:alkylhydroperoxidase family enzyme